ncbi:MAG: hypothetical protein AAF961_09675, partial [Planctomycetota bacterium]
MIRKTFSQLGSVRAMLAAAAILLLASLANWQHRRQAAQLADLHVPRRHSASQSGRAAPPQGGRQRAGLLPDYEPRSFRAATGPSVAPRGAPAPTTEAAAPAAPVTQTADQTVQEASIAPPTSGSDDGPNGQQPYRIAQAPQSPGGESQPPTSTAAGRPDSTSPMPGAGAPADVAFPLVHLEPRQLHERLSEAFGKPLPILQDPGNPWLRFTLELDGDSPVVAAINEQSREVRLVGRAGDVQDWRQVIGALDAPPQAGRTTALVATETKAAPHVRQTVDILLAQTPTQRDPAETATVESPAIEGANPAQQQAIASLLGPVEIVNIPGTNLFIIRG